MMEVVLNWSRKIRERSVVPILFLLSQISAFHRTHHYLALTMTKWLEVGQGVLAPSEATDEDGRVLIVFSVM